MFRVICDGIGRGGWHGPFGGQKCLRSELFLRFRRSEAAIFRGEHGVTEAAVSAAEGEEAVNDLEALDPASYLNPKKRALEEPHGFGDIFSIGSSRYSSEKNGEEKKLQQRKRQFVDGGLGNEDPGRYSWPGTVAAAAVSQSHDHPQLMPYDDFESFVVQRSESSSLSSHRKTGASDSVKNASELARRMAEKDSHKPTRGRPAGANPRAPPPMGEIVEVEGGHIVRSTGRKDRHSKVYTAKGPRDRRVRLSASTAIQFYDLQDRLGYDRPSKAVAWLIEKAKSSIDELAKLPQTRIPTSEPKPAQSKDKEPADGSPNEAQSSATAAFKTEHSRAIARERARERAKERIQERDAKSLPQNAQPVYADLNLFSNSMLQALQLQNAASKGFTTGQNTQIFHPPLQMDNISSDSISRSLHLEPSQSLYQSLLAHTTQAVQNFAPETSHFDSAAVVFSEAADNSNIARNQSLFSCSTASAFQVPFIAMAEQQQQNHHEFGAQQTSRILRPQWNHNTNNRMSLSNAGADHFGAYSLNTRGQLQPQNSYTVRGTLQSSSSPVRVRPMPSARDLAADQLLQNTDTTSGGNFSAFRIPARIQGIDEHDDVKPSAASSNSQL